mmetsp:Transcript_64285/g.119469  ORF Transcript_64285/g.119469 Transcript_64285/m.119469 type:complete len:714 (-) Transcript_64285:128-2269(-)
MASSSGKRAKLLGYTDADQLVDRAKGVIGSSLVGDMYPVAAAGGAFNVLDGPPGAGKTTAMIYLATSRGGAILSAVNNSQAINHHHLCAELSRLAEQVAELDKRFGSITTLQDWETGNWAAEDGVIAMVGAHQLLRELMLYVVKQVKANLEAGAASENMLQQTATGAMKAGRFYCTDPQKKAEKESLNLPPVICLDEVGQLGRPVIRAIRNAMLGALSSLSCTTWALVLGGTGAVAVNMLGGGSSNGAGCVLHILFPSDLYAPSELHPIAPLFRRRPRSLQKLAHVLGRDGLQAVAESIKHFSPEDGVPSLDDSALNILITGCIGAGRTPVRGELAGQLITEAAFEPACICNFASCESGRQIGMPQESLAYSLLRGPVSISVTPTSDYLTSQRVEVQVGQGAKQQMSFDDLLNSLTSLAPDGLTESLYVYALLYNITPEQFQRARARCLQQHTQIQDARAGLSGNLGELLCAHTLIRQSWLTGKKTDACILDFLKDLAGADEQVAWPAELNMTDILGKKHAPWLPIHNRGISEVEGLKVGGRTLQFPLPPQHQTLWQAPTFPDQSMKLELAKAIGAASSMLAMGFCHHRLVDPQSSFDFEVLVLHGDSSDNLSGYFVLIETKNALEMKAEALLAATVKKWQQFQPHFERHAGEIGVLVCGLTMLERLSKPLHVIDEKTKTLVLALGIGMGNPLTKLVQAPAWTDQVPLVQLPP